MSNEKYQEALHYMEGSGGYPKDTKKGWKLMKALADDDKFTSGEACSYVANHFMDEGDYEKVIHYLDRRMVVQWTNEDIDNYLKAVYYAYPKHKKEPEWGLKKISKFKERTERFSMDGCYIYYQIHKWYGKEEDPVAHKCGIRAAVNHSAMMPDEVYADFGRERGVLKNKDEMDTWIKVNEMGDYVSFLPDNINSGDEALGIAMANLDTKATKKILGGAEIRALKNFGSDDTCYRRFEYQPIIRHATEVGTVKFRVEYNNPKYTTVTTGSGQYNVGRYWTDYCATFKAKESQDDLWTVYKGLQLQKSQKDARVRVEPYGFDELVDRVKELTLKDAKSGAVYYIKEAYVKEQNWEKQYIKINVDDYDLSGHACHLIFVPFYFFVAKVGKKTVSARVNGCTKEVDYFFDNPYGLFTKEDNIKIGGGADETRKSRNAKANAKTLSKIGSGAKAVGRWIARGIIAFGIFFLIYFIVNFNVIGLVFGAAIIIFGLILRFKAFAKD